MLTGLYKNRSCLRSLVFCTLFSLPSYGNANSWLVDNNVGLGLEGGNLNQNLSARWPYNSDRSWQLTVGGGAVTSIGGRYISYFNEWGGSRVYWFGGLATWFASSTSFSGSETAVGVSAGLGLDYDLSQIDNFELPLSANITAGPTFVTFDNFNGLDVLSIRLGLYYRFE